MGRHDDDYDDDYDDYEGDSGGGGMGAGMIVVIVIGVCFALCAIISIVAAIAIPNMIEARQHGNEAAAIGALKTIGMAQTLYREGDKDNDGKADYGNLSDMSQHGLIDSVLGGGIKQGYHFECEPGADPEFEFWAKATPAVPGTTGSRYFYVDQSGVIYYSTKDFPVPPPPGGPPPGLKPLGM